MQMSSVLQGTLNHLGVWVSIWIQRAASALRDGHHISKNSSSAEAYREACRSPRRRAWNTIILSPVMLHCNMVAIVLGAVALTSVCNAIPSPTQRTDPSQPEKESARVAPGKNRTGSQCFRTSLPRVDGSADAHAKKLYWSAFFYRSVWFRICAAQTLSGVPFQSQKTACRSLSCNFA